jgi:cell division protein FtsB
MMTKISIGLGLLLIASGVWIKSLNNQLTTAKANQIILETEVARQNEQIKKNLAEQKKTYAQIDNLSKKNQESMREVNALKQTFARHDLDNLALAKPKLVEGKVNRATHRVFENLTTLTDPNQFDEKEDEEVNKPN